LAVVVAVVAQTQQTTPPSKTPSPVEYKIPPEAAQKVNPLKTSAEGTARAKKVFHMDCAMCHGDSGDGKTFHYGPQNPVGRRRYPALRQTLYKPLAPLQVESLGFTPNAQS